MHGLPQKIDIDNPTATTDKISGCMHRESNRILGGAVNGIAYHSGKHPVCLTQITLANFGQHFLGVNPVVNQCLILLGVCLPLNWIIRRIKDIFFRSRVAPYGSRGVKTMADVR